MTTQICAQKLLRRRFLVRWRWVLLSGVLVAVLGFSARPAFSAPRGNTLTMPYVAVGGPLGGWHLVTLVFLKSTGSTDDSGSIEFFDNEGQPLPVVTNGDEELKTEVDWSVPAHGSRLLIITHPGEDFQAGWLQIKASSKSALDVITLVRFYNSRSLIAEAGIQGTTRHDGASSYYRSASERHARPSEGVASLRRA